MKKVKNIFPLLLMAGVSVAITSCSKKSAVTPAVGVSAFYSGNILGSPTTVVGPGNAILLRPNGTMREYANDYYSLGTTITAKDTAGAKIKLDGTYKTAYQGSVPTVTATWVQTGGSPVLTYTLVGTIDGHNMTGTFSSSGSGISSSTQFKFSDLPSM